MLILNSIIAIWRKELQSYLSSPLAYIVAAVFWLVSGIFFVVLLIGPTGIIQQVALSEQQGLSFSIDVAYLFLGSFFEAIGSLILFILPILSMGLYAEERKLGTLELLATSPLTNWAVALGKLLGVVSFFTTLILPLLLYEAIAFSAANPPIEPKIVILAHVSLILLATAILSLGMFISSLSDSSILAAILTFALVIFLWMLDPISENIGGEMGNIISHLSILKHYENLIQGIVDTSSLLIFFSYIILGIFLTAQSIEALRFAR